LTDHPHIPDPAAPPPPTPDGTSAPQSAAPGAGATPPVSGQPWSTPSGDPLSPEPYQPPPAYTPPRYAPGYAPIPEPDSPPTSSFPAQPVNYAPPGYAPDYGYPPPGYPGQPPGYGMPPGPPPRRSNAPLIAVILAVTLLLCGGLATAGVLIARNVADQPKEAVKPITELPTEAPDLPGLPTELPNDPGAGSHSINVTYEVTGDGPVEIIYIEKIGDAPVRLDDVKLPWKFTAQVQTPALLSVVAMRVDSSEGSISCRALVDGDEVKKSSSGKSNFATASCTYFALD
jgi:hypothetical protein